MKKKADQKKISNEKPAPVLSGKVDKKKKKNNKKNEKSEAIAIAEKVELLSVNPSANKAKKQKKAEKRTERPDKEKEDSRAKESVVYLNTWNTDKKTWKFRKVLQLFLINNCYDPARVDNATFPLLLRYFEKLEGNARKLAKTLAEDTVKQSDSKTDSEKMNRAKKIVELLK